MSYFIGGLVGAALALIVAVIMANVVPEKKRRPSSAEIELLQYWRDAIDRQLVICDHLGHLIAVMKDHREATSRIADAVTMWEQRYTRRSHKAKPKEG